MKSVFEYFVFDVERVEYCCFVYCHRMGKTMSAIFKFENLVVNYNKRLRYANSQNVSPLSLRVYRGMLTREEVALFPKIYNKGYITSYGELGFLLFKYFKSY